MRWFDPRCRFRFEYVPSFYRTDALRTDVDYTTQIRGLRRVVARRNLTPLNEMLIAGLVNFNKVTASIKDTYFRFLRNVTYFRYLYILALSDFQHR